MNYLSICSGIEAASVAWEPLGWKPVAFAEIEKFPSAVLAHHWPDVTNLGDMTKHNEWTSRINPADVDVLVGGTPCQSFSVAGLRRGLEDPRGNLTLTFLGIIEQFQPAWVVWENVPGVLSDKGNAFGQFVAGLAELGYDCAWRVLDAQHFGVPQRRRRVFLVGCARGSGHHPAEVLFEPESLRRDITPSRETREGVTGSSEDGAGVGSSHWEGSGVHPSLASANKGSGGIAMSNQELFSQGGAGLVQEVVGTLSDGAHNGGGLNGQDAYTGRIIPVKSQTPIPVAFQQNTRDEVRLMGGDGQIAGALAAQAGMKQQNYVAFHPTQDPISSEDGTTHAMRTGSGQGCSTVAVAFDTTQVTSAANYSNPKPGDPCHPIASSGHPPAVAFEPAIAKRDGAENRFTDVCPTLRSQMGDNQPAVATSMQVRRLTPTECERLQGFPDSHTRIPWRGKDASECPDGPRYKALGNSMAVPVMRWIGERIQKTTQQQ